jgi:hypothetical protein
MGHYNSFLVKVWTDDGQHLVRGYIQHVGTEEVVHFLEWGKMVDFIVNHLNWHINYATECEEMGQIKVELQPGDEKFG